MNKTLIAMAVAGVMAAPMAAQADATVYGKIHMSIDAADNGTDSGTFLQSNSSRIGFKGSEDLGGGLSAIWQYESNASFSNCTGSSCVGSSANGFGGRNSYVGLKGSWGTVLGGRHDTPMKDVARKFDLFGDQVGDSRNVIGQGDGSGRGFDLRMNNVIAYVTPTFGGGFDARVAYVLEDNNLATGGKTDALSANISWKGGDLLVAAGYETHGEDWNAGTESETGMRVGVKWTPGGFIVSGFYETLADIGGTSGNDADAMGVGAGFKMGKNVFKAQYYTVDNDLGSENDASVMAVGWDHNLSKRSTVYIAYATTDNDATVTYRADAGGHQSTGSVSAAGEDPSSLSFGIVHKF
jgi:predicted porin